MGKHVKKGFCAIKKMISSYRYRRGDGKQIEVRKHARTYYIKKAVVRRVKKVTGKVRGRWEDERWGRKKPVITTAVMSILPMIVGYLVGERAAMFFIKRDFAKRHGVQVSGDRNKVIFDFPSDKQAAEVMSSLPKRLSQGFFAVREGNRIIFSRISELSKLQRLEGGIRKGAIVMGRVAIPAIVITFWSNRRMRDAAKEAIKKKWNVSDVEIRPSLVSHKFEFRAKDSKGRILMGTGRFSNTGRVIESSLVIRRGRRLYC